MTRRPSHYAAAAALLGAVMGQAWAAWPNGYDYRRTVTINHASVGNADQQNLPVMIAGTYAYLATVQSGGKVQSPNGYDILITADSAGATPLNFERVSWSATSGNIVLFVNVPIVSHTLNTVLYLFYGNASVAADPQNKPAVWDAGYTAIFHLADQAQTTAVSDSTGVHHGTNARNTAAASTLGAFAGGTLGAGFAYDGLSDYTDLGANPDWDVTSGDATWEFWIKPTTLNTFNSLVNRGDYSGDGYNIQWPNQFVQPNRVMVFNNGTGSLAVNAAIPLNIGGWYYLALVKSGTIATWYVNGISDGAAGLGDLRTSARHLYLAKDDGGAFTNTILSEFRFSKVARTADWLAVNYSNQNNPTGFYSLGAEQNGSGIAISQGSEGPVIF